MILVIRVKRRESLVALGTATAATATEAAATTTTPTAATTTVATATTAAAVTTTATAAAATATGTVFAGLGFIDGQSATTVFLAVQGCNRGLGFLIGAHFHETKTLAATGVPIGDDLRAVHGPMGREQFLQSGAIDIVAQITNIQLLAHLESPSVGDRPNVLLSRSWLKGVDI
jgi:hypothetical protein